jgi:DHA2 family multidrug resistance protein
MAAGEKQGPGAARGGFHPGHNPWAIALTVTLATFMEVLDTSIANVALPHIAGGLSASQNESTWVLTSYLVSNAVVLPISGWMGTRIGRKRFYMLCVLLFTISSFLCGIAPSLGWLIFFRVLQGIGGGGLAPSEQSILADTFEPSKRGMAFAIYGMAVVLAPAVGPTLGGYITDHVSWRWIFFLNVPVGALSLFLTARLVTDPPWLEAQRRKKVAVDWGGLGLVAVGLGALQVVLDKGQEEDWFASGFIVAFAAAAAVGLIGLVAWELFQKNPVVDVRNFLVANVLMFFLGVILFGTTVLLPQYLQNFLGYTAEEAGMVLSPGALSIVLFMPVIGLLVGRLQARWLIAVGFAITTFALYRMTHINLDIDFRTAMEWRIYQSAGMAFLFVPINTNAYVGIPPEKNNQVSGIVNLFRNVGGGLGISLATTLISRRAQYHQTFLVGHATPYDPAFRTLVAGATTRLTEAGASAHDAMREAYGTVYGVVVRQAVTLAYADTFRYMAVTAACMLPLVFLMRANRPGGGGAAAH